MNKNIYIYPVNGEIVTDKEYSVWIKFMDKNMIDIASLKMKINKKLVPALLSENGIIYNQKYALEYGINDVEVNWKSNNKKEESIKWRFVLLEYKIGISEKEINCVDISLRKNENLKIKDIMDINGIPVFSREQLNRRVSFGKSGVKTGEIDLIELLEMKKDKIKNVDESKGYVFGEIIEKSKKHYIYEIVLGKRSENKSEQRQSGSNIKMYHFKSNRAIEMFLSKNDIDGFWVIRDKYNLNEILKEYTSVLDRGQKVGIWGVNSKKNGDLRIKVYGKNYTSGFHEGIRNKRSVISNIEKYKITFSINGRIIGDKISPEFKNILELNCNVEGDEKIKEVKIIGGNNKEIYSKKIKGEKNILIREDVDIISGKYALCVIKCDGNKGIITSPIWIEKKW